MEPPLARALGGGSRCQSLLRGGSHQRVAPGARIRPRCGLPRRRRSCDPRRWSRVAPAAARGHARVLRARQRWLRPSGRELLRVDAPAPVGRAADRDGVPARAAARRRPGRGRAGRPTGPVARVPGAGACRLVLGGARRDHLALMSGLVECVPNVSEGRRPEIVRGFADVVSATPGVRMLDVTSDPDHNRSVLTFAGDAEAVESAALALVAAAYGAIDMRTHSGEHPRLGAVDVVPFVPLSGSTMEDCVEIAKRVGRAVAKAHDVPVYYYAKAATRPERVRLPDIRKPQYEGLQGLMDTTHGPDEGPARVHPAAGAIVVGARPPLIAFNIELDTADVKLAKRIAKEIRESSGGLPAVQAMGFELTDPVRAQVSMNLLDHSVTSLATVWREVETRANAAGVKVLRGELIGLAPLDAMLDVARESLRLDGLVRTQIIEGHFIR